MPLRIELPGRTKPILVVGEDGQAWVWKRRRKVEPSGVFAELLAAMFGQKIGAPIPTFGVATRDGGFLSRYHDGAVHWSAECRSTLCNLDRLGAALAMDAIIGNGDRHQRNLILHPTGRLVGDDPELAAWCVDHENSWLRFPDVLTSLLQNDNIHRVPSCRSLPRDLPLDDLRLHVEAAAAEAQRLTRGIIAMLAFEAAAAAKVGEAVHSVVGDALAARCRVASQIVGDYLSELEEHSS